MRQHSTLAQVIAVLSRRTAAFRPLPEESAEIASRLLTLWRWPVARDTPRADYVPPSRRVQLGKPTLLFATVLILVLLTAALIARWDQEPDRPTGGQVITPYFKFGLPPGWSVTTPDQEMNAQVENNLTQIEDDARSGAIVLVARSSVTPGQSLETTLELLREQYESQQTNTDPPTVSGFDEEARFAGKSLLRYTETLSGGQVDWHVVITDSQQVSVGCQYKDGEWSRVAEVCEYVVRTLSVR